MIYLILSILCSTGIFILFKAFEKFKVNNFQAIVINYFIATITGILALDELPDINAVASSPWFINSLMLGVLFILLFNLMATTAQKLGPSVASVTNKMALVIPVIFAVYYYDEVLTELKIIGIILALIGIYLSTLKPKAIKKGINWKLFLILILLFLGSGLIDTFLKYNQEFHLNDDTNSSKLFSSTIFFTAFILGSLTLVLKGNKGGFKPETIIGGIILGIINYGSIYFLIQTFNASNLNSTEVFPINNMGVVILTSFSSYLIFKEKFSLINKVGIISSVLAILLISLST